MAADLAESAVPVAFVELGSLEVDRDQHGGAAATPPRLVLRLSHDPAADALAPQGVGKEEQVDEEQAAGSLAVWGL
jgi:hypothetical protein